MVGGNYLPVMKRQSRNPFRKYKVGDWVFLVIFILLCVTMIYPALNVFALSLSSAGAIKANKSMIIPRDLDFRAYRIILSSRTIWKATFFTFFVAFSFTFVMLVFTMLSAYVLSRDNLKGRGFMRLFLIITMLFGGGLVPYYIVLRELGFINNLVMHIIPGCLSAYNIFLARNFIDQIPKSAQESARLDGANHIQMLIYIIIPLSAPIIATLAVFGVLAKWNDWFTSYMYLPDKPEFRLLQNIVRAFVVNNDSSASSDLIPTDNATAYSNAILLFCTIPVVCIYPFALKYFTKGLYFGAVKE